MKPIFLGEGNDAQHNDPLYWQIRAEYWMKAASKFKSNLKQHYEAVALGYQKLLDGTAKYVGDKVEWS